MGISAPKTQKTLLLSFSATGWLRLILSVSVMFNRVNMGRVCLFDLA